MLEWGILGPLTPAGKDQDPQSARLEIVWNILRIHIFDRTGAAKSRRRVGLQRRNIPFARVRVAGNHILSRRILALPKRKARGGATRILLEVPVGWVRRCVRVLQRSR